MAGNETGRAVPVSWIIIAVSIVIGAFMLSRSPRFEKAGPLELLETRSGATYTFKGAKRPGRPFYEVVIGPKSFGADVEYRYKK